MAGLSVSIGGMDNEDWQTVATSERKANAAGAAVTLKHLTLTGVKLSHDEVLGTSGSGIVYKAYHNGIPCAAKKAVDRPTIKLMFLFTERKANILSKNAFDIAN